MNFVKFLRTPFFTEHLRWLLLKNAKIYLKSSEGASVDPLEYHVLPSFKEQKSGMAVICYSCSDAVISILKTGKTLQIK